MDAIQALKTRRSVRSYTDDPVKPEHLGIILDCARLAPTGINRQDWRFIAITDAGLKKRVVACAPSGGFIDQAAVAIVVCAGENAVTPIEDGSAATVNILTAAHALGYGTCWVGARGNDTARLLSELLKIPKGYEVITLIALGVPKETGNPDKKSFGDVVSYNGF